MSKWKSRPVFISSTFRDMQAERDYLHQVVFPILEERLAKRYHHLEPIDLRWGVDTLSLDEQIQKETLVLKVCLNEIERSIPFIIVLIGDRYGWVPPNKQMRKVLEEAGHKTDKKARSVTAMEIEYGLLSSEVSRAHSFFYFRKPLPYEDMPKDLAKEFNDTYNGTQKGNRNYRKLQELKRKIIHSMPPDHVNFYDAGWDGEKVVGLERWGAKVVEDLWKVLDKETKDFYNEIGDTWQEEERAILNEFFDSLSSNFIGREALMNDMRNFLLNKSFKNLFFLQGHQGIGKSSILAKLAGEMEQRQESFILSHAAGISPKSLSLNFMLKRWIYEMAAFFQVEDPTAYLQSYSEIRETFQSLLELAKSKGSIYIFIDNIDQLDEKDLAISLKWIPDTLLKEICLVATHEHADLYRRENVQEIYIGPFEVPELMIETILRKYRKKLHHDIIDAVMAKENAIGKMRPASQPLWLKLVIDELLFLDADDFKRLEEFEGTEEQKLHQLLLQTVNEISPDIAGVYDRLLKRTEEVFGIEWTKYVASMLAVSKNGLREKDLKGLVELHSKFEWTDLQFAGFRRYLRSHIKQVGLLSQWDFVHEQAREAIYKRYIHTSRDMDSLKKLLAEYVWNLKEMDPWRMAELSYFLIEVNDYKRLAAYYGTNLTEEELKHATIALKDELNHNNENIVSEILKKSMDPEQSKVIVTRIVRLLLKEIGKTTNKMTVLSDCLTVLEKLIQEPEIKALEGEILYELAELYLSIGDLNRARNNFELASQKLEQKVLHTESIYNLLLRIYERLVEVNTSLNKVDDVGGIQKKKTSVKETFQKESPSSIKLILNEIIECRRSILEGISGKERKRMDELIEKLLRLTETLHYKAPEVAEYAHEHAVSHIYSGDLQFVKGNFNEAHHAYNQAHLIVERLLSRNPNRESLVRTQALIEQRFGDISTKENNPDKALMFYNRSLERMEQLIKQTSGRLVYKRDHSLLEERIGNALQMKGEIHLAIEKYYKELKVREGLQEQFGGFYTEILVISEKIGDLEIEIGNVPKGLLMYQRAIDLSQEQTIISKVLEERMAVLKLKLRVLSQV